MMLLKKVQIGHCAYIQDIICNYEFQQVRNVLLSYYAVLKKVKSIAYFREFLFP